MNDDSCGGGVALSTQERFRKNECCYQSDGPGQVMITLL